MVAEHCRQAISNQDNTTAGATTGKQHQKCNNKQPHHIRAKIERRLDPNYCIMGEVSTRWQTRSHHRQKLQQQRQKQQKQTDTHTHTLHSRGLYRNSKERLPKKVENNTPTIPATHLHEKWSRTTTRHNDTSSPITSTRKEKTVGGLILRQQGTSYRHTEEVYGKGQQRTIMSQYPKSWPTAGQ